MFTLLALLSCNDEAAPDSAPAVVDEVEHYEELAAPRLLRRISLDLRGVLPSAEELDRVEADPSQVDVLRDEFLEDPRLEEMLVHMLAERWHTRVDVFNAEYYDFGLSADEEFFFEQSVGEEPLRLMARIAVTERPWPEILTAETTVANEMLARIWPLDYPEGETGWHESSWTDGRPHAGVLVSNGLWWRYYTNEFNQNRSRANAVFRLLTCQDFLARPVTFASSEESDVAEAIRSEPACVACHSAIEPVAAGFFGFWWRSQYSALEMSTYHAEREPWGEDELGVEQSWFGEPYYGLEDLGAVIGQDRRFHRCTADTFSAALWRREVHNGDFDRISTYEDAYFEGDHSVKELLRAITDGDVYRAGALVELEDDRELTARMLAVHHLGSALHDLSGFNWVNNGFDQLENDAEGFRVLAGGVNGSNVISPQQVPGLTWALFVKRLAQAHADRIVHEELELDGERSVLLHAHLGTRPDDEEWTEEVLQLHWRLHAVRADEDLLAADRALWEALYALDESPANAWRGLLGAMFRDPEFAGS